MLRLLFAYLGCCITSLRGRTRHLKTHINQAKRPRRDQYFTWAARCAPPGSDPGFGSGKGHQAGALAPMGMTHLKAHHLCSLRVHFSHLNLITILCFQYFPTIYEMWSMVEALVAFYEKCRTGQIFSVLLASKQGDSPCRLPKDKPEASGYGPYEKHDVISLLWPIELAWQGGSPEST